MTEYIKIRKDSLDDYIEEYKNKYKYQEYIDDTQEEIEEEEIQEEEKQESLEDEQKQEENIEEEESQEEEIEKEDEITYDYIDMTRSKCDCVSVESCVACIKSCKTEIIEGIGGVVSLVPVVLAQFELQVDIVSNDKLPENIIEIKNVDNNIKITQCILIQTTNALFVKGYVRKNIQYTTITCSNSEGTCGDFKHCTIDIPFECSTSIDFNGIDPEPIIPNSKVEFEYYKVTDLPNEFAEKDKLISGDMSEYNQESTEHFNRLPYCNLVSAKVVEANEYINMERKNDNLPFEEKEFDEIETKMVLYIELELLQERDVLIPPKYM